MAARQTLNAHQVKLVRTEGVLNHAQRTSLVVKQLSVQLKVIEQVVLVLRVLKEIHTDNVQKVRFLYFLLRYNCLLTIQSIVFKRQKAIA